jgi:hypothetical protein
MSSSLAGVASSSFRIIWGFVVKTGLMHRLLATKGINTPAGNLAVFQLCRNYGSYFAAEFQPVPVFLPELYRN